MSKTARSIIIIAIVAELFAFTGCVRRRLTLRTDPPGATVYLDNVEIGKTPISRDFNFYGTRELRFVKEGCETHTEMIKLRAPWYEWVGLDFVSETLVPGEILDRHNHSVKLRPLDVTSPDVLIAQAEQLKGIAHSSNNVRIESVISGNSTTSNPTNPNPSETPTDGEAVSPFSPAYIDRDR